MFSKEDRLKMFVNEIEDISDSKLRKFAEELIANAEDYFFTVPASSSGKYHPTFDLGDGGLVRHTRCVEYFARCMAESLDFSAHDTDLITIAAIAHDIVKQGKGSNGHTVTEHPIFGADYVLEMADKNPSLISKKDAEKIADAVRSHMGKWGAKDGLPKPKTEFEKALQVADYIASRKDILDFNFRPTETVTAQKHEESIEDLKNYVITFGKHKGETLEQARPSGYLDWLVGLEDCFNKECQDKARLYLESLNAPQNGLEILKEMDGKVKKSAAETATDEVDDLPF